jgi:spermidine dehydrogenase
MGDYHYPRSPNKPCVVKLVRTPCKPGLPTRQQHRAERIELYTTPLATFEGHVRDQLGRILGAGGFDSQTDILAIIVNRWPHGYAYSYSTLFDPKWPAGSEPHVIGRRPFGSIAIANADSGVYAETSISISEALRACREALGHAT